MTKCPKCSGTDIKPTYVPPRLRADMVWVEDHLQCRCQTCGYLWSTDCHDKAKEVKE